MNRANKRNQSMIILHDMFDAYHILKTYAESVNDTIILKKIKKWESYSKIRSHTKLEMNKDYPEIIAYYKSVVSDVDGFLKDKENDI